MNQLGKILTKSNSEASATILACCGPVSVNPELAVGILERGRCWFRDCHQLALKTLPEVQAVFLGLKLGIDRRDPAAVVGDREEPVGPNVEGAEFLSRRASVLSEYYRRDSVVRGQNRDTRR